MAAIFTTTGTKVYIGPSVATEPANAAAYAALSWTEVGFIETLSELGDQSSSVSIAIIGDGRTRKAKGARDAGDFTITCAYVPDDTGQQALIAAEATYSNYAFKAVLPNRLNATGTDEIRYFMGLVMGKRLTTGGNDAIVRQNFPIGVNSEETIVAATAGA
jgi:hypothetical protein